MTLSHPCLSHRRLTPWKTTKIEVSQNTKTEILPGTKDDLVPGIKLPRSKQILGKLIPGIK